MGSSKWRWLLIGSFSAAPTGRKYAVSGERFTEVMKRVDVRAEVPIPPLLGERVDGTLVELHFDRPRMFRTEDVIAAIAPLQKLQELAKGLARDKDVAPAVAAARVEKIVGPGRLAEAVRGPEPEEPDPEPDPVAEPGSEPATVRAESAEQESTLDAIFSKVDTSSTPVSSPKSGLDKFIGAMRSGRPKGVKIDKAAALDAAATIRDAVSEVAFRILGHPALAKIESCWRGLKMVMGESPGHEDLAVHMADVDDDSEELKLAVDRHVSKVDPDRPDAVFIANALAPSTLSWLAELATDRGVAIVVGANEALTGRVWHDPDDVSESPEWAALRDSDAAAWLCAAANPIVLANEETRVGRRLVLGSPAWGVAALLTAAIKRKAGLSQILGRPGALVAPAAHELEIGMSEPRTIPTAQFASLPQQQSAAKHGVMLLGSAAGSDQIIAASATMVRKGAMLPDRIQHSAGSRG